MRRSMMLRAPWRSIAASSTALSTYPPCMGASSASIDHARARGRLPIRRYASNLSTSSSSRRASYYNSLQPANNSHESDVLIIGAGVAGLTTAHYLLRQSPTVKVCLIDRSPRGIAQETSRINGGLLCPSLSNSWTSTPLVWGEDSMLRMAVNDLFQSGGKEGQQQAATLIKFDPKLLLDRRLWNFALHWMRRKPHLHSQNEIISYIMHYSMQCYDDPTDDLIQSLEYDRTAVGTKTNDGRLLEADSSGDINLFCNGLYEKLVDRHGGDRFTFYPGVSADSFETNGKKIQSFELMDAKGDVNKCVAKQYVISSGNDSYSLCRLLNIPCPVFPVKGYIIVFHSDMKVPYNLELSNKSYIAPIGEGKYHLSGFAEFLSTYNKPNAMEVDMDRANALINVAKEIFPDMEVDSVHVGYRPLSPDDTPLIGRTKYDNLFLNTGGGSKGWTMGPGSGKLLADIMLGLDTDIDAMPYSPRRFEPW